MAVVVNKSNSSPLLSLLKVVFFSSASLSVGTLSRPCALPNGGNVSEYILTGAGYFRLSRSSVPAEKCQESRPPSKQHVLQPYTIPVCIVRPAQKQQTKLSYIFSIFSVMYINHIQSNNKCNNVTIYWLALLPKNVTNLSFASERTQAAERSQLRRLTAPRCSNLRLIPRGTRVLVRRRLWVEYRLSFRGIYVIYSDFRGMSGNFPWPAVSSALHVLRYCLSYVIQGTELGCWDPTALGAGYSKSIRFASVLCMLFTLLSELACSHT